MSDNLSSLTRRLVVGALPPEVTAEQRTDTELVLFLVGEASTKKSAPAATNDHATEAILKVLSGEAPITVPDHLRRVVDEALELRKRCDKFAEQLADARKALAEVKGSGRDSLVRVVRLAVEQGKVADEVPQGPLRALVQDVVALFERARAAEETRIEARPADVARTAERIANAEARAADAEKRAADAEAKAAKATSSAMVWARKAHAAEARASAATQPADGGGEKASDFYENAIKGLHQAIGDVTEQAKRENLERAFVTFERAERRRVKSANSAVAKAEATTASAEAKAKKAGEDLTQTRAQLEEARAAIDLARQALRLPAGTGVEDLIAALQERFAAAPPSRPAKPKARDTNKTPKVEAPPPPPAGPPPMHEVHWHETVDGDLALDRAKYRNLRNKAARVGVEKLTDDDRRILVLRVGDQLIWLRGDGLYENNTNITDAPRWQPTKRFSAGSGKALVIAEGVKGGQVDVADAWQEWLRAAEVAPGLDAVLDDSHALSPAEEEAER